MPYMSLCVVMTDWGNLRDLIFPRTGFAKKTIAVSGLSQPNLDVFRRVRVPRRGGQAVHVCLLHS